MAYMDGWMRKMGTGLMLRELAVQGQRGMLPSFGAVSSCLRISDKMSTGRSNKCRGSGILI